MKKKVFREIYNKRVEELLELDEKTYRILGEIEEKPGIIEVKRPTVKIEEEPKKRGRRKSVKSNK